MGRHGCRERGGLEGKEMQLHSHAPPPTHTHTHGIKAHVWYATLKHCMVYFPNFS